MKRVLGKKISGSYLYNKNLLRREKRVDNRLKYKIFNKDLPFVGYDVWHCYEISFLTNNNCPVVRIGKLVYPCTSKYIVESKSLKLYLNSFNMTTFGKNYDQASSNVRDTIIDDLTNLLECEVKFEMFDGVNERRAYNQFPYYYPSDSLEFTHFNESPEVLQFCENSSVGEFLFNSDLLRSNCKVTHQPDIGDIFIYMFSKRLPVIDSLFQYIVSFRSENHFHEEVVEMIYKRLWDGAKPERLVVGAIYTRRGGIDICPCRASHEGLLDKNLIDINCLTEKLERQ